MFTALRIRVKAEYFFVKMILFLVHKFWIEIIFIFIFELVEVESPGSDEVPLLCSLPPPPAISCFLLELRRMQCQNLF
jgi:hypothetical protein